MKIGDLVVLKDNWAVPGALTALKFYGRIKEEVGTSSMLVIDIYKKDGRPFSALVLVNGYKKVLNLSLLKVVSESR